MKPNPAPTDIVIIGCGPAGAAASIFLSKAGIHHTVLDKDVFPRNKVCGDGCSGKTVAVLKKANPAFVEEIFADAAKFLPSHGVVFAAPNGKFLEIPYKAGDQNDDYPPGFTTKRFTFDHFLFEKMNSPYAHIVQDAIVQQLQPTETGYQITYQQNQETYQIAASLIIGADGDKGICRKQFLNHNEVSKTSAVGLRAYYTGVTGMHPQNFIELHFLNDLLPGISGYFLCPMVKPMWAFAWIRLWCDAKR